DLFNKGVTVEENVRALEVLRAIKRDFGDACDTMHGHGMIFLTPLATLEDLRENLRMMKLHAPEMLRLLSFGSRLTLYSEIQPLYQLLDRMGLVVPSDEEFGFTYRFRDPRIDDFLAGDRWLVEAVTRAIAASGVPLGRHARTTLRIAAFEAALGSAIA